MVHLLLQFPEEQENRNLQLLSPLQYLQKEQEQYFLILLLSKDYHQLRFPPQNPPGMYLLESLLRFPGEQRNLHDLFLLQIQEAQGNRNQKFPSLSLLQYLQRMNQIRHQKLLLQEELLSGLHLLPVLFFPLQGILKQLLPVSPLQGKSHNQNPQSPSPLQYRIVHTLQMMSPTHRRKQYSLPPPFPLRGFRLFHLLSRVPQSVRD